MQSMTEGEKRAAIVETAQDMNASGLNHGTSGNLSLRHGDGLLITPTGRTYDKMGPQDICRMAFDGSHAGPFGPSSEWRFHRDILANRNDVNAVVHAHPDYATALAIHGQGIPPVHYMVGIFGGADVRCAPYHVYGSQALSDAVLTALEDRFGCLLAHHGIITLGSTLAEAYWRAWELETLAKQYLIARTIGEPPCLSDEEIATVLEKIRNYGAVEG